MARRTLDHSLVSVYYKGMHDSPRVPTGDVGPDGLLQYFNEWAQEGLDLSSTSRRIHTSISSVQRFSRSTLIDVATGAWGDDNRRLINHQGRVGPRDIDEDDAPTVTSRAMLLVPPGGDLAMWFIEREGTQAGGSRVWSSFDAEIRSAPKALAPTGEWRGLLPDRKVITRGDAWMEAADLRAVSVSVYSPQEEVGDSDEFTVRNLTRRTVLSPQDRRQFYPRNVRDQVFGLGTPLEVAEFFGVTVAADDGEEIDSVKFTVGDGEYEKTYEMDSPGAPQLRVVLNDNGQNAISSRDFVDECASLASATFAVIGQTFEYAWMR